MKKTTIFIFIVTFIYSCTPKSSTSFILVTNNEELSVAIKKATPGDEIILKNGSWRDVTIEFVGNGTKEKPIVLRGETPGEVFIEGRSNLKLGGEYLEVRDLFFRDGFTPEKSVIEFRINEELIANHSKVTNCVIYEFTQANRHDSDHWVEFWGRHNELSNCYIAGKSNFGPTVMVMLKGNEHSKNYHRIINNHFGPRPRKGGPHGETMQLGDSGTSMVPSHTVVEGNLFERCNGEVEIISSKSNYNSFRNNVFFKSEGSLVLRHGNYAEIDGNLFIGSEESDNIGGIRVINTGHWIVNNNFYRLMGNNFRAPIAVMNGIPKSPQNRYNQVTDAVIAYNSFIDCGTPFQIGVGSNIDQSDVLPKSEIRSARPIRMTVANNYISNKNKDSKLLKLYDKADGINFKQNLVKSPGLATVNSDGFLKHEGDQEHKAGSFAIPEVDNPDLFKGFDFETIQADLFGNRRSGDVNNFGALVRSAEIAAPFIDKKDYGPHWFNSIESLNENKTITVTNAEELILALETVNNNDIIVLMPGNYVIDETLIIDKSINLRGQDDKGEVILDFQNRDLAFRFLPKANLKIEGVSLIGSSETVAFEPLSQNMSKAYNLFLDKVKIQSFNTVLKSYVASFADTISIKNVEIKNCNSGILLNSETNDKGDYNAEFLIVENTVFKDVKNEIIDYYRGGYDESTIGGNLLFVKNQVRNCGTGLNTNILIRNRGIVNVTFKDNEFVNNAVDLVAVLWGEKGQAPENNSINNSGVIEVVQNLKLKLMY